MLHPQRSRLVLAVDRRCDRREARHPVGSSDCRRCCSMRRRSCSRSFRRFRSFARYRRRELAWSLRVSSSLSFHVLSFCCGRQPLRPDGERSKAAIAEATKVAFRSSRKLGEAPLEVPIFCLIESAAALATPILQVACFLARLQTVMLTGVVSRRTTLPSLLTSGRTRRAIDLPLPESRQQSCDGRATQQRV